MLNRENLNSWENRSRLYGTSIHGVLFKNLPSLINEHIHLWHVFCIQNFLGSKEPQTLLDIGCGYGRLSLSLLKLFPLLKPVGIDISKNYVNLYQEYVHRPARLSSVENIPDDLGTFEVILAVTILMYVPSDKLREAMRQMLIHLENNGLLIIIEHHCSGKKFQNPFGLRNWFQPKDRITQDAQTGGRCFDDENISGLITAAGGEMVRSLRMPLTTFLIIPLYIIAKICPPLAKIFLRLIFNLEKKCGSLNLPSLHTAYLVKKK